MTCPGRELGDRGEEKGDPNSTEEVMNVFTVVAFLGIGALLGSLIKKEP